jgi:hypothetical protein
MEHYYTFKDATARKKIHPVKLAMWSNTAFNDELSQFEKWIANGMPNN